ncbi:MAG: threonine aldolase family protein [Magnetovibrionaceae bacterium]
MHFITDTIAGASPEVLEALAKANEGLALSYGGDGISKRLEARFQDLFQCDCRVLLTTTGTAANALSLSVLTPAYGTVLCHEGAHAIWDECAAPEFFTGGAKLMALKGANGKITPEALDDWLAQPSRGYHQSPDRVLSLTQATEVGTVYGRSEIAALAERAKAAGLRVHMDGARFANALVSLGLQAAEITWKAGIDVLSFGATKNGCMAAEAVVLFDTSLFDEVAYRRKRAGHLPPKMRFIAAQMEAYLEGGLWLANARRANRAAKRLALGLDGLDGVEIAQPVQANGVFASLPPPIAEAVRAAGYDFYPWPTEGYADTVRMICSYATPDEVIDDFIAIARAA